MLEYKELHKLSDFDFFERLLNLISIMFVDKNHTIVLAGILLIEVILAFLSIVLMFYSIKKERLSKNKLIAMFVSFFVVIMFVPISILIYAGIIGQNNESIGQYETVITPVNIKSVEKINGDYRNLVTIKDNKNHKVKVEFNGEKMNKNDKVKVATNRTLFDGDDNKTREFNTSDFISRYSYFYKGKSGKIIDE